MGQGLHSALAGHVKASEVSLLFGRCTRQRVGLPLIVRVSLSPDAPGPVEVSECTTAVVQSKRAGEVESEALGSDSGFGTYFTVSRSKSCSSPENPSSLYVK